MKKKQIKYLVSWSPIGNNCVYGKDERNSEGKRINSFTQPLVLSQAKKRVKDLWGGKVAIYKLVKVKEFKGK